MMETAGIILAMLGLIVVISNPIKLTVKQFICVCTILFVVLSMVTCWGDNLCVASGRHQETESQSENKGTLDDNPESTSKGREEELVDDTHLVVYTPLSRYVVLEDSNEVGSASDVSAGNWKDIFGTYHSEALKFWVIQRSGWSNAESITFELNEQCQVLSGYIVAEERCKADANCIISIYLDGELAYQSEQITRTSDPVFFELPLVDIGNVRIVCATDANDFGHFIVSAIVAD